MEGGAASRRPCRRLCGRRGVWNLLCPPGSRASSLPGSPPSCPSEATAHKGVGRLALSPALHGLWNNCLQPVSLLPPPSQQQGSLGLSLPWARAKQRLGRGADMPTSCGGHPLARG